MRCATRCCPSSRRSAWCSRSCSARTCWSRRCSPGRASARSPSRRWCRPTTRRCRASCSRWRCCTCCSIWRSTSCTGWWIRASAWRVDDVSAILAPSAVAPPRSHWRHVLGENPVTFAAAVLFGLFALLAIAGPWIVPYDPLASSVGAPMSSPSWKHWFGTDSLGRDILSRVVVATRLDFGIATSAVLLSFAVGGLLGASAGYYGGTLERVVGRFADMVMAFPLFVLAMGIVAAMGNTVANIVIATAVINLPFYIRVARTEVSVRRDAGFVEAARLAGNSDARILLVHLVTNALPPMMVQLTLNMG